MVALLSYCLPSFSVVILKILSEDLQICALFCKQKLDTHAVYRMLAPISRNRHAAKMVGEFYSQ